LLIVVVDPSGRFTGDIGDIRGGLTSSVDLMPMLVTLGNLGSTDWMSSDLAAIYGQRHDMVSMLQSKDAPGRAYVLLATDEIVPNVYNPSMAPTHVLGFRTDNFKLGISTFWTPTADYIVDPLKNNSPQQEEFYDYSFTGGQMELNNSLSDPRLVPTLTTLVNSIIPNELQQPLPGNAADPTTLRGQQVISKARHLAYREILENINPQDSGQPPLSELLGYGGPF
jgi:hypothetical protein